MRTCDSGTGDGLTGDSEMPHIDKCPRDHVKGKSVKVQGKLLVSLNMTRGVVHCCWGVWQLICECM